MEVVGLASRLQRRGVLHWVRAESDYAVLLHGYAPGSTEDVARLLTLLKADMPSHEGEDILIPLQLSVGGWHTGALTVGTRSLFELIRIAAAAVEVPKDVTGAMRLPAPGPAGRFLRIRSSTAQPTEARVATQYNARWYYIARDDEASKVWFTMLQFLAGSHIPELARGGPILTIPVTGRR